MHCSSSDIGIFLKLPKWFQCARLRSSDLEEQGKREWENHCVFMKNITLEPLRCHSGSTKFFKPQSFHFLQWKVKVIKSALGVTWEDLHTPENRFQLLMKLFLIQQDKTIRAYVQF